MKNDKKDRIDTILSSLDQVQRASAPDYLYTRIRGRRQKEESTASMFWLIRPFPLIGLLLVFLFINAALIWNQVSAGQDIETISGGLVAPDHEVPYAVATEYRLHDNVTFYDNNSQEISSR